MKISRLLRIGCATTVALTTTLTGCATKKPENVRPLIHGDPPAPITPTHYDMCHPLPPSVLFENNKAALLPEAKAELDKICADLKKYEKDRITIIGHTSDSGIHEYNEALGLRRAEAAKAYMIEQGIAAERIQVKSMADEKPAVPNDSPANMKLNRRVTFEYEQKN